MILSDVTIQEYIYSGKIKILPEFNPMDIRPTGIRLHLGYDILLPKENDVPIDVDAPPNPEYDALTLPDSGFVINKDMFILGTTFESIMTSDDIICHLEGRSTIARLGLAIHCTSGMIDNNHDEARSITLELKNIGAFDLLIRPRIPIGMLVFSILSYPIRQKSQSQYRRQASVEPPNLKYRCKI